MTGKTQAQDEQDQPNRQPGCLAQTEIGEQAPDSHQAPSTEQGSDGQEIRIAVREETVCLVVRQKEKDSPRAET